MHTITQSYKIKAPIELVWQALTQVKHINGWGGGPAKMSASVGGAFSLWGGDMHGTNTVVVPHKKLIQDWYSGDWEEPSVVVFSLNTIASGTQLKLTHTGVPADEIGDIDQGWRDYYLGPLQDYVERISPSLKKK